MISPTRNLGLHYKAQLKSDAPKIFDRQDANAESAKIQKL
jgi:hypothetical protein